MPAGTESEDADPFVGISPSEIRRPRPYFCVWCEEMTRFVCEICEMPKAEMKKYQVMKVVCCVVVFVGLSSK